MTRYWLIIVLACSFAASFLLYRNTLPGQFVFDDEYFTLRKELRSISYVPSIWLEPLANIDNRVLADTYRPLLTLSMMMNFIMFGSSPLSFHWVNIVLHAVVTVLFFVLTYYMFRSRVLSVCSALLFVSMPIHVEAVAFIKAREEMLGAMFFLASWMMFERAVSHKRIWNMLLVISVTFFIAACLSKEFFLISPAIYFLTAIVWKKLTWKRAILSVVPYGIGAFGYCVMWWIGLGGKFPFENLHSYAVNPIAYASIGSRLMTAVAIAGLYVSKTIIPLGLSATYRFNHFPLVESFFDPRLWLGMGVYTLLGIGLFAKKIRRSPLFLGSLIYVVLYFPFSKLVFVGGEFIAERWMYAPSLGIALCLGIVMERIYRRSKIFGILILIITLSAYSIVTVRRNVVWLSPEALYQSMTRDAPGSMFGYVWLARHYLTQGRFAEAEENVRRALSIYPSHHQVQAAYAAILLRNKQYNQAEQAILRAINLKPEASSYYFYAVILAKEKRYQDSQRVIDDFLAGRRDRVDVKFLSAVNYWNMGNSTKAREYFDWSTTLSEEEKQHALESY